ncbi:MAG: acyl-CoA synthetase (NDP forming) [Gammaproteobacteria bacterium]|jgi:acyl-CoA synthetase (NDP forming)
MNELSKNLDRLLNPRHIAFIGGNDAAFSAEQCARHFRGPVWGVNPKRDTLGGVPCFASVDDLPEAPDAVFLATPRSATLSTIKALRDRGAGGVVCYTAGYGELGDNGQAEEVNLVAAAGNMALIGPNCYGLINYTNGATLWPFGAGNNRCERGIALVMQSGMLPANLTMNDRSVPITYVISAGNQSQLAIEDYIDRLVEDDRVTGFGVYIEAIRDIKAFSKAALRALEINKPIAVLKAGSSPIAARLAMSHTGSLAGTDEAFEALFKQLGIIRVVSPVEMIETLKFLSISGAPKGKRIAAFTCSGGDAGMLADYCNKIGLELPQPSAQAARDLAQQLPDIATVSNPLDYTTPVWGNTEVMPGVFKRMIEDNYDAAIVIQDFPPKHIHEDNSLYRNDAASFASAVRELSVPGAVCSDLPENIDAESRKIMIANGITPLQGLDSGLDALANACHYGINRQQILERNTELDFDLLEVPATDSDSEVLDEFEGKQLLKMAGISIPAGMLVTIESFKKVSGTISYPAVIKAVSANLPHKSEAGAVKVNLQSAEQVEAAMANIQSSVKEYNSELNINNFLVESMVSDVICELMIGVNTDSQFGQMLVIAGGGILVELLRDSATLLLPTSREQIDDALRELKIYPLLTGFRGRPSADIDKLLDSISAIASFAQSRHSSLIEMDINPLMITPSEIIAVDVMIRQSLVTG